MTPLNLMVNARPDEQFHLQPWHPTVAAVTQWWRYRRVDWADVRNADGSSGTWTNRTFRLWATDPRHFRAIQWYHGTAKCDPTRTFMLWGGRLGGTDDERTQYVMTTTPKELLAVRVHPVDNVPVWTNMGGC